MKTPTPDPNDIEIHKNLGNISTSITIDVKNNVKVLTIQRFNHKRKLMDNIVINYCKIERFLNMIQSSKCEADEWIYKNVN